MPAALKLVPVQKGCQCTWCHSCFVIVTAVSSSAQFWKFSWKPVSPGFQAILWATNSLWLNSRAGSSTSSLHWLPRTFTDLDTTPIYIYICIYRTMTSRQYLINVALVNMFLISSKYWILKWICSDFALHLKAICNIAFIGRSFLNGLFIFCYILINLRLFTGLIEDRLSCSQLDLFWHSAWYRGTPGKYLWRRYIMSLLMRQRCHLRHITGGLGRPLGWHHLSEA